MRRRVVLVAIALVFGACGSDPAPLTAPPVPVSAVPATVAVEGGLTVQPVAAADIRRALREVGEVSLVKDGRVWEVRQGDRLVGMLQLSSIGRRADTRKEADRLALRRQILTGEPTELDFAGVPVYQTTDGSFHVFVWFGRQMLGTLTLKGVDPDVVSNELVTRIIQDNAWPNLSPDDFEDY